MSHAKTDLPSIHFPLEEDMGHQRGPKGDAGGSRRKKKEATG